MATSVELVTSYRPTFLERLRAAWDLSFGSMLTVAWTAVFPILGLALLWTMTWPSSRNTASDYLLLLACFAFVPVMFLWNTYRAHRADWKHGPYNYRFTSEGIHVTTPATELTHRWPAILRVRVKRGILYLYFTKTCAHCVPVRVLQSAAAVAAIQELAAAGGVRRVGT